MVITKAIYRYLVVISWSADLIWTFFRDIYTDHFDNNVRNLLTADGYSAIVPWSENMFWAILIVTYICYMGLFNLKRWSIWLLIVLDIAVLLLLAPLGGVEVSVPVERIARNILLMTDGALIALAFFSDLRDQFK